MHRRDRHHVAGIRILLHINRSCSDQIRKGNELVRETSVAVFSVRVPDNFCINDSIPKYRIAAKKGK